jgi:small conductance mechanosensitive channel
MLAGRTQAPVARGETSGINTDSLYRLFRDWGLSDFWADALSGLVHTVLAILIVVVLAKVASRVGSRVVRRSVHGLATRSAFQPEGAVRTGSRPDTLAGVAANVVRVVVWTVAVLVIVDKLGINAGPVLAATSIAGVAVGFGAQYLVRDFLSGFFLLAEDQFAVGDAITILDVTGTVEEVNLRTTRLRADDGTVWFVPNGEIRKVGNSAKDWSRAVVDVALPSEADIATATAVIAEEIATLPEDPAWADVVVEAPQVLGVESMGTEGFTIRVAAKTKPAQRTRVARELRVRIGARLRREGIVPLREPATPESVPPSPAADDSPSQ